MLRLTVFLIVYVFLFSTALAQPTSIKIRNELWRLGIDKVLQDSSNHEALKLASVWDSLSPSKTQYNIIPQPYWQKLLEHELRIANERGEYDLKLRLAFPLAANYHSQSKFRKGLPLLEYLYHRIHDLPGERQKLVLIKLEEEYRALGRIGDAIEIRRKRIDKGYIKTFWELYRNCGLYAEALSDFLLFELVPKENDIPLIKYYTTLGGLYLDNSQPDSAVKYFGIAKERTEELQFQPLEEGSYRKGQLIYYTGHIADQIGKAVMLKHDYRQAIEFLLINTSLNHSEPDYKIDSWLNLADCYLSIGKPDSARVFNDSARNLLGEKVDIRNSLLFYRNASRYFRFKSQPDSALYYMEKYSIEKEQYYQKVQENQSIAMLAKLDVEKRKIDLSLANLALREATLKSDFIETKYTAILIMLIASVVVSSLMYKIYINKEKRRKEIEKHNIQLAANNEKIRAQNNYNETLLKELHHRVKNNLQVMYSLLNMEKRKKKDEDVIDLITVTQGRIRSMALVHQNLYGEENFEWVDIEEYVVNLVSHVQSIYLKPSVNVKIEYFIEPLDIKIDKALPVGLIINEAVSNAFKYAFREGEEGVLRISIKVNQGKVILEISDNGRGYDAAKNVSSGIGMSLIQSLCKQLDAEYSISMKGGVTHHLKFVL